jgi:hypothetical protein
VYEFVSSSMVNVVGLQAATEELLECKKARDVAVAELDDLESKVPCLPILTLTGLSLLSTVCTGW